MTAAAHKLVDELKARARRAFVSASKQHADFISPHTERRFWPVLPTTDAEPDSTKLLERAATKASPRRFNAEPITGFGALA